MSINYIYVYNYFNFGNLEPAKSNCPSTLVTYGSCFLMHLPPAWLAHSCWIHLPTYLFIMSLPCWKPFKSCPIPIVQSRHSSPGIKPPLQSGSNFLFLPHFPLFPYNIAVHVNSLLQSIQSPLKRLWAFFFSDYRLKLCAPPPFPGTSSNAGLDHRVHSQVRLPVLQMYPSSAWDCKLHVSRNFLILLHISYHFYHSILYCEALSINSY